MQELDEDYYREQMENLRFGREQFIPFLEQHTELTPEDEKLLAEIMATESDWFRVPEEAEQSEDKPHYTVEQTSGVYEAQKKRFSEIRNSDDLNIMP